MTHPPQPCNSFDPTHTPLIEKREKVTDRSPENRAEMVKNGKALSKNGKNCISTETPQKRSIINFNAMPYKEYYPRTKTAKKGKNSSDREYQKAKAQRQTQKAIKNALKTSKNAHRATERKKTEEIRPDSSSSYRTKKTPPTIRKP